MQQASTVGLPRTLANYEVAYNRDLGKGKFGIVCIGKDTNNGTEVAVKRVSKYVNGRDVSKYVDEEFKNIQALKHPNIIKCLRYEKRDSTLFLILELCQSDMQKLVQDPQFSFEESLKLKFAHEFTQAIKYMHNHNVIHRDLKPENILVKNVNGMWIVKVSDFGLSRLIPAGVGSGSFSATGNTGTKGWMAPELIGPGRRRYTKLVDVYSGGLIFLSSADHKPGMLLTAKRSKHFYWS